MKTATTNYTAGTRVRSYDFPNRVDCYVEGRVIGISDDCYQIRVDNVVVEGQTKPVSFGLGRIVQPPLNGLQGMFGVTKGVTLADQNVWHAEDPSSPHRNARTQDQGKARLEAIERIAKQQLLPIWQVAYKLRAGRRVEHRADHVLDYAAAMRKADTLRATGAVDVAVTPLHVYTHDA